MKDEMLHQGDFRNNQSIEIAKIKRSNSEDPLQTRKPNIFDHVVPRNKYLKIQIIFEVSGVGISEENLQKLFMNFN